MKANNERKNLEVTSVKVTRAKPYKDNLTFFDMELNGIMIYGCRFIEGSHGDFVGFPSKENDGEYYNVCWAKLSEDAIKVIKTKIEDIL